MGCKVGRATAPQKTNKTQVTENSVPEGKPQILFILGGPGSGKGTVCDQLVKNCGFQHFSTGDLLRKEQEENPESEISKNIKNLMTEGKLVSSDILVDLIKNAIKKLKDPRAKILLDGFPRSQENIDVWTQKKMDEEFDVKFVLFLECGFETMEKRLMERAKTSGRADDNPETIKKRFDTFEHMTKPIIEFYEKNNKLVKINAETDANTVFNEVLEKFKEKGLKY